MMRWIQCGAGTAEGPPCARMGHVAVPVDARETWNEELLLIHGGLSADKYALGDLVVLQTGNEAWYHPATTIRANPTTDGVAAATGPPARAFHCGAAVGQRAYIFGGHVWVKERKGLQKFNDLWCLNTDTWEWAELSPPMKDAPVPPPRDFAQLVPVPGPGLLMFGGLDGHDRRLDDTWLFSLVTGAWSEVRAERPRPKARYGHTLTRMDARVFLHGGEANSGLLADLWTLRGVGGDVDEPPAWIPLELPGVPPVPRKGHAAAALGRWLVVMGGRSAEGGWFRARADAFRNDVALVDRAGAVAWRALEVAPPPAPSPTPREFHSLTPLSGDRLLLFGGGNGKTIFGDAWWLDTEHVPPAPPPPTATISPSAEAPGAMAQPSSAAPAALALSESAADAATNAKQPSADCAVPPAEGGGRQSAGQHSAAQFAASSSLMDADLALTGSLQAMQSLAIGEGRHVLLPSRPSAQAEAYTRVREEPEPTTEAAGPQSAWFAGSPDAAAMEQLRARLAGEPPGAAGAASAAGLRGLAFASLQALVEAYRATPPAGVRALQAMGQTQSGHGGPAAAVRGGAGRFLHVAPGDVRLGDLPDVQAELRAALAV